MRHETFPVQRQHSVEELLFHWPQVLMRARSEFERSFALSIAGRAKRRGWTPTPKQLSVMRQLVERLFQPEADDFPLVE